MYLRLIRYVANILAVIVFLCVAMPTQAAGLTQDQISSVLSVLQSFNVDQSTLNRVSAALGNQTTAGAASPSCVNLTTNLSLGMTDATTGGQVSMLQQALGLSPTGVFDTATQEAVQAWQSSHQVVSSGSPQTTGWGTVGPQTRHVLQCGSGQGANSSSAIQPFVAAASSPTTAPAATTQYPIPSDTVSLVRSLYSCVLMREPTQSEVDSWTKQLPASISLETLYRGFFFSNEYTSEQWSDADYVKRLYECALFREPTSSEVNSWNATLGTTDSRYEALLAFLTSSEFKTNILPSLTAATGAPLESAADTKPVGPYIGSASTKGDTLGANDKVLMTVFFDWYNKYTGAHVTFDNGMTQLTDHPVSLDTPPFTYASVAWWEKEMSDMSAAGIDVFLPDYWAFPVTSGAPENPASYGALGTMVQAMRDMDARGMAHPKVGMFYDTSTLGQNPLGRKLDLTVASDRDYFYRTIRDFWSQIPPQYWARIGGKPIVTLFLSSPASGYSQATFDDLNARFSADFNGQQPYVIRDTSWKGVTTDSSTAWGGATNGAQINGVAQIGPGFNDQALIAHGDRPAGSVSRENGAYYSNSWQTAINSGRNLVILETWNEFHEGSEIAPTQEYGTKYTDLTRQYAAQWRASTIQNPNPPSNNPPVNNPPPSVGGATTPSSPVSSSGPTNQTLAAHQAAVDPFFTYLYSCILSRAPEPAGLAYWEAKPAGTSLTNIYSEFFLSPEYQQKQVPDQSFVTQLYQCVLKRTPATAEINYWASKLASGTSRADVVAGFTTSSEFVAGVGKTFSQQTGFSL